MAHVARVRKSHKETAESAAAPLPYRDNIADSRKLIAELDARPKDAPISELGRELRAIKQKYIENGGTFITSDEEFERVVRQYRYGIED